MRDVERELQELGRSTGEDLTLPPFLGPETLRRARRRRAAAALGSAGLLLVGAVGGYAAVSAMRRAPARIVGPGVLAAASETTQAAGTARAEFTMNMSMSGTFQTDVSTTGQAEIDFRAGLSHMVMEVEALGGKESVEMILDGTDAYTRPVGSDTWTLVDPPSGASVDGSSMQDPTTMLADLRAIADEVEELGTEEIAGVRTTHYRASWDPWKQLDDIPPELSHHEVDMETEPFEVWVDDEGRVRRVATGFSMSNSGEPMAFTSEMRMTMTYFDFGIPVEIEVPDPRDVQEGTDGLLDMFGTETSTEVEGPIREVDSPDGSLLQTERGLTGPMVALLPRGDTSVVCISELPGWVETAQIVNRSSRQVVANAGTPHEPITTIACSDDAGSVFELGHHPARFDLILTGSTREMTMRLQPFASD